MRIPKISVFSGFVCLGVFVLCMPVLVSLGGHFIRRMASSTAAAAAGHTYSPGTHSIAYVTAPNEEEAKKLAHKLVKSHLAACVNVIPKITSIYEWQDKVEEDSEVLMMIKTRSSRIEELSTFVRENHPYDVCEVITTPISGGNPPYLEWLGKIVPEK